MIFGRSQVDTGCKVLLGLVHYYSAAYSIPALSNKTVLTSAPHFSSFDRNLASVSVSQQDRLSAVGRDPQTREALATL